MSEIICRTCGKVWSDEVEPDADFAAYKFSTANNPKGTFLTVSAIIQTGEALLSCPADPDPILDRAIQESYNGPKSEARKGPRDYDGH